MLIDSVTYTVHDFIVAIGGSHNVRIGSWYLAAILRWCLDRVTQYSLHKVGHTNLHMHHLNLGLIIPD